MIKKDKKTEVKKELDPIEYFNKVKSRKKVTSNKYLKKLYKNTEILLKKAHAMGQDTAMEKLLFTLDVVEKEQKLLDMGFNTFVYRDDIDDFIDNVANKSVKTIELKKYPREIPDDIADKVVKLKKEKIFDEFCVVFTDYTDEVGKQVKEANKRKDPILFGLFLKESNVHDRFYYIADWEDEYCDLTLAKMVSKMSEKGKDIKSNVGLPDIEIDDIREYVSSLDLNRRIRPNFNKPFFKRVKTWLVG